METLKAIVVKVGCQWRGAVEHNGKLVVVATSGWLNRNTAHATAVALKALVYRDIPDHATGKS